MHYCLQNYFLGSLFGVVALFSTGLKAQQVVEFKGIAKMKNDILYVEKHKLQLDKDGKILTADTSYESSDGKLLAKMSSDFSTSLTAPAHFIENLTDGNRHGIRYENSELVLFNQDKDKKEEIKKVSQKSKDIKFVGCQGLNYFILQNLEDVISKKKIKVRFLIPGLLDYYDFELEYKKQDESGTVDFELHADSFFIRLFAPTFYLTYNKNTKRLISFDGLSNIKDPKSNKLQVVKISYEY
jgi:hypothetical protein